MYTDPTPAFCEVERLFSLDPRLKREVIEATTDNNTHCRIHYIVLAQIIYTEMRIYVGGLSKNVVLPALDPSKLYYFRGSYTYVVAFLKSSSNIDEDTKRFPVNTSSK